jgi:large subunit ribosomal protein L35
MSKIKVKSHSGAKKRFKITATGKVKVKKSGNNHLLTNKGKNHKNFPSGKVIEGKHAKNIKNLLPYK